MTQPEQASGAMRRVWLGLGGNIGDVAAAMRSVLDFLDGSENVSVTAISRVYKTPPWGVTDQPWFLNACCELETALGPEHLLRICQQAERALKRERIQRWGPRTIDVDILVFEGEERNGDGLTLPHPRMTDRAFVLQPLMDLDPSLMVRGKSVREWYEECDPAGIEPAGLPDNWWRREV